MLPERLRALRDEARATSSSALIVIQRGRVLVDEWYDEPREPIQTMSVTKSVLALAAGPLVHEGKLALDEPLAKRFAPWRDDPRGAITLRQLLEHRSGLDPGKNTWSIYKTRDFVQQALGRPLEHPPGTHYAYNNPGANLVAELIARASGQRADRFVDGVVFEPLGIQRWTWSIDRSGHAHGLAGLHLLPRDLARIGELILNDGAHGPDTVIRADWVASVTREPAEVQPLDKRLAKLWWLLPEWTEVSIEAEFEQAWRAAGVDADIIDTVRPLFGKRYARADELLGELRERFDDPKLVRWNEATWKRGLPDVRYRFGPIVGTYAAGSLGQYLVVVPRDQLVAVRMRRAPKRWADRKKLAEKYHRFAWHVVGLTGRESAARGAVGE